MIKYNLKCHNNHEFESWFSDSKEFENLNKKKLLECIFCTSKKISKSIMAPMISNRKEKNINIYKNSKIIHLLCFLILNYIYDSSLQMKMN